MAQKIKVAVLGANGMLGSMIMNVFNQSVDVETQGFTRKQINAALITDNTLEDKLWNFDYVINCIGLIRPRCKDNAEEAIKVNALFPHRLARVFRGKIIQIATDCADDTDIYGTTKRMGEVQASNFVNIRCSIIGPGGSKENLLEWYLSQEKEQVGTIKGYVNHLWNGVTTLAFAKMCLGLIKAQVKGNDYPFDKYNNLNFVPFDYVSKYQLLEYFRYEFYTIGSSVLVEPDSSGELVDKRLKSQSIAFQPGTSRLWELAGYESIFDVKIQKLVNELAIYMRNNK